MYMLELGLEPGSDLGDHVASNVDLSATGRNDHVGFVQIQRLAQIPFQKHGTSGDLGNLRLHLGRVFPRVDGNVVESGSAHVVPAVNAKAVARLVGLGSHRSSSSSCLGLESQTLGRKSSDVEGGGLGERIGDGVLVSHQHLLGKGIQRGDLSLLDQLGDVLGVLEPVQLRLEAHLCLSQRSTRGLDSG